MASSRASTEDFVRKVRRHLDEGRVYEDTDEFAFKTGLLMGKDKEQALELVKQMAELARKRPPRRKSSKEYLRLLARSLDNYQLMSSSWISSHVSSLPAPKKKVVQEYTPGKKVVDIRTLDNPDFPKQVHILSNRQDAGCSDTDIGSDPDTVLGSPLC